MREYLIYRIGPLGQLTFSNTCNNGCISITVPPNIVTYACSNCVQEFYTPTATDSCGCIVNSLTCNPPSGSCFGPGLTTVTCTATDACGNSNTCSFTVDVVCTNCFEVTCPTNKTVQCNSGWMFDLPTVFTCCTNEIISTSGLATKVLITPISTTTNGTCPQTITQTWQVSDACGDSATCSQTVTVCCTNSTTSCCGPGLGEQTIQWLDLPTEVRLLRNTSGSNTSGTWIITNLPCYGRVLVTQTAPTNVIAVCSNGSFGAYHAISSFDLVTNSEGMFEFTETVPGTYGPYSWGITPGAVELGYRIPYTGTNANLPPYTVTFYFLDGQPSACSLVLSTIGLAQSTTNTLSQPFTFRTEYDLFYNSNSYPTGPSADTMVSGIYGPPLSGDVSGTVIGSAYDINGGDDFNTGWAVFQPQAALLTTNLPPGSGTDYNGNTYPPLTNYPYINVTVNQEFDDVFSLTLGYICCPTNCFDVQCPSNKIVPCGTPWTFDQPVAYTCCTNQFVSSTMPPTNILITPLGIVTNGACPIVDVTQTWLVADACGDSNYCSQTVTITGCCSNIPCLQVQCPSNKTVTCGVNWSFDIPIVTTCCTNEILSPTGIPTNILIITNSLVTNGSCPLYTVTQTWAIIDGCQDVTNCSQVVTVECCETNCIELICPSNIVLTTCTNCAVAYYAVIATNSCCFSNVALNYSMTSGSCFPLGTTTVTVTAYDPDCASTPPAMCTFTVTVNPDTNCCTNLVCCGPGLGAQTINWLNFPTNGSIVLNPLGTNPVGSWIVTNMGCYGNVLVTQDCPSPPTSQVPDPVYWLLSPYDIGVPGSYGSFVDMETGYGPYAWGTGSWLDLYNSAPTNINYTVTFYFLDEPPNPCLLMLGIDGLGANTTVALSQNVTFRGEYDLNSPYSDGTVSAYTTLNYAIPLPTGSSGNVVGSGDGPPLNDGHGDYLNTGWALLQPDAPLPTTNLPAGSVQGYSGPLANLPYVSLTVTQEPGDGIGFTVGYICCTNCSTNCLQVQIPNNKTVPCGTDWAFDTPTATSCCTNDFDAPPGTPATNVLILPISTVTNGACPLVTVTQTWQISDLCGDITNCSQIVTIVGCCSNGGCIELDCPSNIVVTTCSNCLPVFFAATGTSCCTNAMTIDYNPPSGYCFPVGTTTVQVSAYACGFVTNCEFTVTVLSCETNSNICSNGCITISTPANIVIYSCTNVPVFYNPTALDTCCNGNLSVTCTPASGSYFAPGTTTTVTCAVLDFCGLSNNCQFTVTVICTNCLQVDCPTNKTVQCDSGWVFDTPTGSTCCKEIIKGPNGPTNLVITSTGTVTNGTCPLLSVTQSWSIVDGCNNSATCQQVVTVVGYCCTNCLEVQCPSNMVVQCGSAWSFVAPTGTTCCSNGIVHVVSLGAVTNGTCPKFATNTWSIYDDCGFSNTCSQVVTIIDTMPPMITCPTNTIVVTLNSNCDLVIPGITVTASDNCTPYCSLIYSQSPTNGTIITNSTSAYVTVTVTDLCGNSNSCTVHVEGEPKAGLTVDWPTTLTASNCLVPCASNYITAYDCSCPEKDLKITQTPPCDSPVGPGVTAIIVTVTDCNGANQTKRIPLTISGTESFISALTNTGVNTNGQLLAQNAIDPHYTLGPVASPPPPGYVSPHALAVTNLWPWLEVSHVSEWIAPTTWLPANTNLDHCAAGYYTYTNKFTLPSGANPGTASISGRWAADDGAVAMDLNGFATGNTIPLANGWGVWTPFTINGNFINGQNTLLFVVTNWSIYSPGPTGLRVEFTNASVCSTCVPPVVNWTTGAQTVQEGSLAAFTVSTEGTPPFTYQWQVNNTNIEGATNAVLELPGVTLANAGLYNVIVIGPCGIVIHVIPLNVSPALPWANAIWNVPLLTNPLTASFGPNLVSRRDRFRYRHRL